ncbi:MAG: hypothetical protein ACPGU7_14560 [Gammaproteobacteria bacterium]
MPVKLSHIALSAEAWAPEHVFKGLPPIATVATALARQVDQFVQDNHLDHYPALEHLFRVGVLTPNQISTIRAFCARSEDFVSGMAVRRLQGPFVHVRCDQGMSVARTLPHVLPRRAGAVGRLAEHYAFNRVRLMLIASSPARGPKADIEHQAAQKASRWLRNCCMAAEIRRSQSLG